MLIGFEASMEVKRASTFLDGVGCEPRIIYRVARILECQRTVLGREKVDFKVVGREEVVVDLIPDFSGEVEEAETGDAAVEDRFGVTDGTWGWELYYTGRCLMFEDCRRLQICRIRVVDWGKSKR